jgi:hypothetical protein
MLTITDLKKAANAHMGTVEQDAPGVFQCVAPKGKWWRESNGPHLRVDFTDHVGRVDKEMKQDAIQDAMDRMSSGLEDAGDE